MTCGVGKRTEIPGNCRNVFQDTMISQKTLDWGHQTQTALCIISWII